MKKLFFLFIVTSLIGCNFGPKNPPIDFSDIENEEDEIENVISVKYSEMGGVKTIPVKINGTPLDAIFDTGCSGMHLSMAELKILYKNGKITDDDFQGYTFSQIADGSLFTNAVFYLDEVEIAPGLIVRNVLSGVSLNDNAPVLLGNDVLDNMASYEIDIESKEIHFRPY